MPRNAPRIDAALLEHIVWLFLRSLPDFDVVPTPRAKYDFLVQSHSTPSTRIAVEVKHGRITTEFIIRFLRAISDTKSTNKRLSRALLVTASAPSTAQVRRMQSAIEQQQVDTVVRWISAAELPHEFGFTGDLPWDSPSVLAELQAASLVKAVDQYTGFLGEGATATDTLAFLKSRANDADRMPLPYQQLRRQFPIGIIQRIQQHKRGLSEVLSLGRQTSRSVVVMLSDIKNFSQLVRLADPEVLQETMSKYYRVARELVWTSDGLLDKFIGDAVLAIWGYPFESKESASGAVQCAARLVVQGRSILDSFVDQHDEIVDTGTRVGLAAGRLWVINSSDREIEVAFVGNAINLAARLESQCETDGLLMTHQVKRSLDDASGALAKIAKPTEASLSASEAKGQMTKVRVWHVAPTSVRKISNG